MEDTNLQNITDLSFTEHSEYSLDQEQCKYEVTNLTE